MIKSIYKTLLLFEDVQNEDSQVTANDYCSYLNRMFVFFSKNQEIAQYFDGLIVLGADASHANVKSAVFHMIKMIDRKVD